MKNIIFILLAMTSLSASSQSNAIRMYKGTGATYSTITTQTNDSITNTETTYFYTKRGSFDKFTSGHLVVSFNADTTSGTPTTINVIQQGSFDGVTWFRLNGTPMGVDGRNCDTLTMTTAANATFMLSTVPGSTKLVYGSLVGSAACFVPFYRLMFVAASGTHNTVISNVIVRAGD